MRERFLTPLGDDPVADTPEQFAANIKADIAHWAKIVKGSGITLD
jgi:tripartite-type tricarboxylate transporter receptor subunit TctC